MSAASKFIKGDQVTLSLAGLDNDIQGPQHRIRGVVTGYSKCRKFIRVKRQGCKRSESYHPMFWQRL